jgi:hypothetical protein
MNNSLQIHQVPPIVAGITLGGFEGFFIKQK